MASYGDTVRLNGLHFVIDTRPAPRGSIVVRSAESAVDGLMARLQVHPRMNTDVIDVMYPDSDPARARQVVNRVVAVFQTSNAAAAQRASVRRRQFLESQLKYHDSVLNGARGRLSIFRGRQRAYSTKQRLSTEQQSLTELQLQRENLAADRQIYQDLLSELNRVGGRADDSQVGAIMSAPGIAGNPVVAELFNQLTRYQGTRDSLTGGRFGRPETNSEVQKLDGLIASTKTRLTGAVGSYLNSLDARIASLDRLRAQSSSAFPELSASEEEEAGLEEEVEAARITVGQLRSEYEKARLAEAIEVGQVEIVSLAAMPKEPEGISFVRKGMFVMLLGLILGLAAALIAERLNRSVHRRGQVERALHVSELAVIPAIPSTRRRTLPRRDDRGRALALRPGQKGSLQLSDRLGDGLVVASDVHSIAAEAYRLLRTNLLFSLSSGSPRTVLITSAAPSEGKTTVAANLAIAFAQQGLRVLLIDADMRRGRLHDLFRLSREPGLSQVLAEEITLEAAVRPTPVTGLFMLTTGRLPDTPSELVGAGSMRRLLDQATREYGVVILDSPPVLAAADASVITSIADATIIVVRAGQTDQEEAQATIDQLTAVGGKVVGAVLNDPNTKLRASASYYKYYGPATR
jgi:capsular exopolysaccharide synthesis family protein